MISAADADRMVAFYRDFAGLTVGDDTDSYVMLSDSDTGQSLCITKGSSVGSTSPGIAVDDIGAALKQIVELGGSIRDKWDYGPMVGANCSDPEGNEVMVWQIK